MNWTDYWCRMSSLLSVLTIWWCPCVESSLVLLEKGFFYDWYVLLTKLYQPFLFFILYSKAKLIYYSRFLLTSCFCIPIPYDEKDIFFFLVLVLKGLVGLHRTCQLELLWRWWLGRRLGLLWMVCLGNELRSFCRFWDCTQVLHFRLLCWLWGLLHFLQGILGHYSR